MRSVHKYPFDNPTMEIELPRGSKVVHVGYQHGKTTLWVEVNLTDHVEKEKRRFQIHGTGHPIMDPLGKYVGTTFEGPFVWHVYEH